MKFAPCCLAAAIAFSGFLAPSAGRAQATENAAPAQPAPAPANPQPEQKPQQKPAPKARPKPKPKPKPKPAEAAPPPVAAPAAAPAPIVLPDPPTPVVQARQIGLDQCAPMLDSMSRETLTTTYDVQSGWSPNLPAQHIFQSVAILTRPGNVPPDGLAALVAAPMASGACDGVILQVFPLAGDCAGAQKILLAGGGKTIGPMINARIMIDAQGRRLFLVPGYANTCIAVAVDSRFAPR